MNPIQMPVFGSRRAVRFLPLALLLAVASRADAQLAVSSNDNKVLQVDGVNTVVRNPRPDTATVIDLGASPPKVLGEIPAPGSWQAPPQSVALAPDESIALVANSTRIDPADASKTAPDDVVTVIDLKASPPAVLATLHAGRGASGISINRAGTLALVANRNEGTVSVLTIRGKTVAVAGKVDLGDRDCGAALPVFSPDGTRAFVTRNNDHKVSILSVSGTTVTYTKRDISANLRPYGIEISPKGDAAYVANIGNGPTGGVDTISVIDLTVDPPRMVDAVTVGIVPEGIALSPDGTLLAVNVMNGSNVPKASGYFHDFAVLKILRVNGTKLTPLAEARVPGHWCEGAAWSRNQRTLLVQCMVEKALFVYDFDGKTARVTGTIKVDGGAAGIRTAPR
jgi:DNA-binding beta-propeller fold protein YncE